MEDHDHDGLLPPDMISDFVMAVTTLVIVGIAQAEETGILAEVPHGYCFSCDNEGQVWEVIDTINIPVQPPICKPCMVKKAIDMVSNPEEIERLVEKFNGIQGTE